jgi:hypothetical protein
MTSHGDNTEDQPTSAGTAGHSDSEDYPGTTAGTSHGAGDAETELVPPVTVARPEHAWSTEEPITEAFSRPWRSVWAIAGIGLVCAVIVAFAIFGVVAVVRENRVGTQPASTAPAHAVVAPALAPPPHDVAAPASVAPDLPRAARPDDDEFVALAISPSGLASAQHAGFGTSGTQEGANRIALSECRAASGNDDCLPVGAGMFHGCVSYAIDSSRRSWASGSGPDPGAARAEALRRLELPAYASYVQCSDPPGEIRAPESAPSPAAEPAPPKPVAPPLSSQTDLDERFLADITAGGMQITDVRAAIEGAHETCAYLAEGHSEPQALAVAMRNNASLTRAMAITVVDVAIAIYCPTSG